MNILRKTKEPQVIPMFLVVNILIKTRNCLLFKRSAEIALKKIFQGEVMQKLQAK